MPVIELKGVVKRYGGFTAVADLSLTVEKGELLWLFGPSGCGKTTVLRLIAGLEVPDEGTVMLHGRVVAGPGVYVAPAGRGLGMVFQDLALWPHMSVERHLDFVLKAAKIPRTDRYSRIGEMLALCRLEDRRRERPAHLSGGEQQRLAIVRALAPDPPVILLDEPFSNLDTALRQRLFSEILRRKHQEGLTTIMASHDGFEMESEADRIVRMSRRPEAKRREEKK